MNQNKSLQISTASAVSVTTFKRICENKNEKKPKKLF